MPGTVQPVTFLNKNGSRLFGILHLPAESQNKRETILLLSPGIKGRVAPYRLYLTMANRFVELGYPVFRFDVHGLGDSEGDLQEQLVIDVYNSIEVGRYVDDTIAAMDWMSRETGAERFIAAGLCGGAITGLLTAGRDSRIVSLIGLGIPVIRNGTQINADRYLSIAQLQGKRDGYLRKFRDIKAWRSWVRFVTGQSDYRLIAESVIAPLWSRIRPKRIAAATDSQRAAPDNTNPHFAPAFFRMMETERRIFLAFGGTDRFIFEYEAKFVARNAQRLATYDASVYSVHVIPNANHILSFPEWQEDMLSHCCAWLRQSHTTGAGS